MLDMKILKKTLSDVMSKLGKLPLSPDEFLGDELAEEVRTALECNTWIDDAQVTMTRERYEELDAAENKLSALEAAGVDNWPGYSEAMKILAEQPESAQ